MKQYFKHFYALLTGLLLAFVFFLPVQAEEQSPPTIIPLAYGETKSGSFSATESTTICYSITISQKQAITVYGNQTEGTYVSLEILDQDMRYVDHQSSVQYSSTYKWRTDILEPGNYYIGVSSHYSAQNYTIAYDPSPFPGSIPLAAGQTQTGSFSDKSASDVYYSINLLQDQSITVYGNQTAGEQIDLSLYDQDGDWIGSHSYKPSSTNYSWQIDDLEAGNYYISVSPENAPVNYTITYASGIFPNAITLDRAQPVLGHTDSVYKIILTEPLTITFQCAKDEDFDLYLKLYNENGVSVDFNSLSTDEDATFSWTPKKLSAGTYYLEVTGNDIDYNIYWQVKGPSAVKKLRAAKATTNTITLKWSKAAKASKYIVYKYDTKKKTYTEYKTVTSTTCKIKKLKTATKYKFKVVPVMKYGSEQIQGEEATIATATSPKKVNTPTVLYKSPGSISGVPVNYYKIKWKKVKGASGYQVYVKGRGTNGWKKTQTSKSTTCLLYVIKGYSGQVKVRAYTSNNGNYSYGAFSKTITIKSR